jgi:hypothetical protein
MKLKLDRIISIATLIAALVAIILVLKKPAPVAQPQAPASVEHAQAPEQKIAEPQWQSQTSPAVTASSAPRIEAPPAAPAVAANSKPAPQSNSNEISALLTKTLGNAAGAAGLSPDSNVGSAMPNIKDQQVTMDGDVVHGRFLTEIAGKDVWVTISGHMGEKDGYATFDPTEFKVGDMEVPISLVNPALQRKLAEERDRLKIPNNGPQ